MSKRVYELFLFDIYVAIAKIVFVTDKFNNSESLKHDFMAWDSVIREFEIMGEATNILIKNDILDSNSQIVVDFRNLLIHHYFGIDSEEVWDVIHNDLQEFRTLIEEKIKNIEESLKQELTQSLLEENMHLTFVVQALEKFNVSSQK